MIFSLNIHALPRLLSVLRFLYIQSSHDLATNHSVKPTTKTYTNVPCMQVFHITRTTTPPLTDLCADLARLGLVGLELLPDDGEVWLVRRQAQHDEIGVGAAQTVMRVRGVVGLRALTPDVVHDLVLAYINTQSVT